MNARSVFYSPPHECFKYHYLCHGFQQMFDISQLSVVAGEHRFNTIDQILNRFTHGFCLLLSLSLHGSLGSHVLRQLLMSREEPLGATNGMLQTGALKEKVSGVPINYLNSSAPCSNMKLGSIEQVTTSQPNIRVLEKGQAPSHATTLSFWKEAQDINAAA